MDDKAYYCYHCKAMKDKKDYAGQPIHKFRITLPDNRRVEFDACLCRDCKTILGVDLKYGHNLEEVLFIYQDP